MKSIQVSQPGGPDQLQYIDTPTPTCKPTEVLVKMKVSGINFIDTYMRSGLYKPPHYPFTLGKEGSGIIEEVGKEVTDLKVGDRVAFCESGSGTYAEYVSIDAKYVVKIPDEISFETAGAVMLQGLTAYYLSHETFKINKNHHILIHAGAGGVGLLLTQMSKMLGAKIITTVSNDEKAKLSKDAGSDNVVNYTATSFVDAVKTFTNNNGVDVIYDGVGKTTFYDGLQCLKIRGMMVSFGQASGPVDPLAVGKLSEKALYLTRPMLNCYTQPKENLLKMSDALFDMIIKGNLKITIGQRYPLEEAAKAHVDLEGRKTVGKSILIISK